MTTFSIPTHSNSCIKIPANVQEIPKPVDNTERIGVSMKRAAEMLDLSERSVWTLVNEKKIHSVKCGSRTIVSVQSIREFVDGKIES
jgi:ribosome-interacting GTPase 1